MFYYFIKSSSISLLLHANPEMGARYETRNKIDDERKMLLNGKNGCENFFVINVDDWKIPYSLNLIGMVLKCDINGIILKRKIVKC